MKKRAKRHSWTSIYLRAVARGFDEGYAANLAYRWEAKRAKQKKDQP